MRRCGAAGWASESAAATAACPGAAAGRSRARARPWILMKRGANELIHGTNDLVGNELIHVSRAPARLRGRDALSVPWVRAESVQVDASATEA